MSVDVEYIHRLILDVASNQTEDFLYFYSKDALIKFLETNSEYERQKAIFGSRIRRRTGDYMSRWEKLS